MSKFFVMGAVAGWLLVSMASGRLLPALSLPTILAAFIGGVVGEIAGAALAAPKEK
jgi:hypothetical protein